MAGGGRSASRHKIGCINKDDRQDKYNRITHVGGTGSDGKRWKLSLDEAINGIETDKYAFFTHVGGHERDVIVATSRSGRKYLRTTADHDTPDNLLSLPECP
ncbi:DUF3892 domain-containing protein [Xanthomonas campestris]|uniref:DUF3892 domain-containing protein n=1 Tax=Xanthomonas campestris TaxID=339 RepID=UPI0023798E89|nr:DUF3892 domain-containing protein [Xanthomonas campestris]WDJ78742.1 DUF3892 domain-containing protein [Xanthomonas campestris pv. campestris]